MRYTILPSSDPDDVLSPHPQLQFEMDVMTEIPAISPVSEYEETREKADIELGQSAGSSAADLKGLVTDPNPFADPDLAVYLEPIKEYEGYHRFDPKATWTEQEERRIVRKIDFRIMVRITSVSVQASVLICDSYGRVLCFSPSSCLSHPVSL